MNNLDDLIRNNFTKLSYRLNDCDVYRGDCGNNVLYDSRTDEIKQFPDGYNEITGEKYILNTNDRK